MSKESRIKTTEDVVGDNTVAAPDKVGRFVDISHDDMMKRLQELSQNFTHEEAYVELADGRVYHKIGGRGEVNFTEEERAMFRGGSLYHNHNYEPPSSQDIAFLYTYRLNSLHAIAHDIDFVVHAPEEYMDCTYKDIIDTLSDKAAENLLKKMQRMKSKEADIVRIHLQFYEGKELCDLLKVKFKAMKIGE